MSDTNPYASPAASLSTPQAVPLGTFVPNGKSVDASEGINWIKAGFKSFFAAPVPWLLAITVFFGTILLLSLIPFVGLLVGFLAPLFNAGFFAAGEMSVRKGTVDVGVVFEGFRRRTSQLIVLGLAVLAGGIACGGVAFVVGGGMSLLHLNPNSLPPEMLPRLAIAGLTYLLLLVPLSMAAWFAPGLVLLAGLEPIAALTQSFNACLKNFLAFFVYGVAATVVAIIACIPLGLGLFVAVPALIASFYPAYASVFLDTKKT